MFLSPVIPCAEAAERTAEGQPAGIVTERVCCWAPVTGRLCAKLDSLAGGESAQPVLAIRLVAFLIVVHGVACVHRPALAARCRTRRGLATLVGPRRALRGRPIRFVVVSERKRSDAKLVILDRSKQLTVGVKTGGGPPYWWYADLSRATAGRYEVRLIGADGKTLACARRRVRRLRARSVETSERRDLWPNVRSWNRSQENLYSTWIERLFDAPERTRPSWTPLHQVIHDPQRNFLHNYLGHAEDSPPGKQAVVVKPDCADLPYYLRAYFAWKLRLPFGYRHCDRGSSRRPPHCRELRSNAQALIVEPEAGDKQSPGRLFSRFLRRRVSYVHSASGRTAADDEQSDFYPLRLSRSSLRPGATYVDPYGHLLVLAKWVPQRPGRGGLLYAVDGHPDLSVGRKRFWRGAFLFSANTRGGAGGFKAFRPLVLREGEVVAMSNSEIRNSRDYRNFSTQQYRLGLDGFYEKMEGIISPAPLKPTQAYRERLDALYELVQERVDSVAAGERYMKETQYATVEMPPGPKIFETRGAWENYSTPARDLRLLIAIEDVLRYPRRVIKKPQRFVLQGQSPAAAEHAMRQLRQSYAQSHAIEYQRSDGKTATLTLAQLLARRKALEVAYNPNDCVELRWGESGDGLRTCRRRAPVEQQERMAQYRNWFATRTRPPIR